MQRHLINNLVAWKTSRNRKPLLIYGARQTGKTWLMKFFGENYYDSVVYIDFTDNERMRVLFSGDFNIIKILSQLALETGVTIVEGKTLIIFDEIQEASRALTALKYFYEKAPGQHIVAAGSLLGIATNKEASFPVGKVDSVNLYPMSFTEFLMAMGKEAMASSVMDAAFDQLQPVFSEELADYLKDYLVVGGMPEVVADFAKQRDYAESRRLQENILKDYDRDFSKHASVRILERIRLVWGSIPSQLAKENQKFIYGAVRKGARAKDLKEAIQWLVDYGVVYKIPLVSAIRTPLSSYSSFSEFKLFLLDVGLLGALSRLDVRTILEGSALFTEFKGSLTEQCVEQQLEAVGIKPSYWSSPTSSNEMDFVVEIGKKAVPIEVKAAENLKSKSLRVVCEKYQLPLCVRTSLSGYRVEEWMINIPLWAIGSIEKILGRM